MANSKWQIIVFGVFVALLLSVGLAYAEKSTPIVKKLSVPRTLLSNGDVSLYRFSVSAATTGSIGLGKFTFSVAHDPSLELWGFRLYGYADPNFASPAYSQDGRLNGTPVSLLSDGTVELYFNPVRSSEPEPIQVGKGETRYFELRANLVSKPIGVGLGEIAVALLGDTEKRGIDNFTAIDESEYDNFIWSGNSTTTSRLTDNDWLNGFGVKGLSADLGETLLAKKNFLQHLLAALGAVFQQLWEIIRPLF